MLPQPFINDITQLAQLEPRVNGLIDSLLNTPRSVAVRFNPGKLVTTPATVANTAVGSRVPWCDNAFYLPSRPAFTLDPALHQGLYYVQDASSMFIAYIIKAITDRDTPVTYLDACAAPGGKSTAAIDALPHGSLVVANEWDYRRAEILRENLIKWGYPGCVVSRGDTKRYSTLRSTFDIIAADVPCSGEGMMRKDAEAVAQWSPALVNECADRQRLILDNLWPALRPGGYLIYSTCTFNRHENEEIIEYMIEQYGAEAVNIEADRFDGILPAIGLAAPCYRFMPHLVDGEGLFMALLRKPGDTASTRQDKLKEQLRAKLSFKLPPWMPGELSPLLCGNTLYGILPAHRHLVDRLSAALDVIMPGVEIATLKGRDLIPSHGLALSTTLDTSLTATATVDHDTALAYLRRDTVTLPPDAPRGHLLLLHNDHPLGWVKNLGNRANNLYPATWRILTRLQHT